MSSNIGSEKEIVDSLLRKEQGAWKEWYHSISPGLMSLCIRYVRDRDLANDVLQNSFIKMFHSIPSFQFRGEGSLKAWASRIVINEALRELKSQSGWQRLQFEQELAEPETEDPDVENLAQEEILELILQLPDGYRTVFNLYVFENLSHKQIAEQLNIGESTSASQLHRAKGILAEKIKLRQRLDKKIL